MTPIESILVFLLLLVFGKDDSVNPGLNIIIILADDLQNTKGNELKRRCITLTPKRMIEIH